ncbi:MAG: GNAT family N-acetyltransferase [Aureliella sp.]
MHEYELTTERLGMRRWRDNDLDPFAKLNCDSEVMKFFPRTLDREESKATMLSLNAHLDAHGFTYYAVDLLGENRFIGFVGLKIQLFDHPMTPLVDVGWRLCQQAWGQGLATEAAKRCLQFAFNDLKVHNVSAIAPELNVRSIAVMQRIGMGLAESFHHPLLDANSPLVKCQRYAISR